MMMSARAPVVHLVAMVWRTCTSVERLRMLVAVRSLEAEKHAEELCVDVALLPGLPHAPVTNACDRYLPRPIASARRTQ